MWLLGLLPECTVEPMPRGPVQPQPVSEHADDDDSNFAETQTRLEKSPVFTQFGGVLQSTSTCRGKLPNGNECGVRRRRWERFNILMLEGVAPDAANKPNAWSLAASLLPYAGAGLATSSGYTCHQCGGVNALHDLRMQLRRLPTTLIVGVHIFTLMPPHSRR